MKTKRAAVDMSMAAFFVGDVGGYPLVGREDEGV